MNESVNNETEKKDKKRTKKRKKTGEREMILIGRIKGWKKTASRIEGLG